MSFHYVFYINMIFFFCILRPNVQNFFHDTGTRKHIIQLFYSIKFYSTARRQRVWKERNKRDRIRVSEIAIKRLVRTYQRMGQRRRCRSSAVTGHHRRTRTRTRTNCSQSHYSSASMERSCACAPLCVCVCVCYMHVTG